MPQLPCGGGVVGVCHSRLVARHGRDAGGNPWRATSLEWQTPTTPPPHGNWGKEVPVVYRWAYDYSVPGAPEDFIPQNDPWQPKAPAGTP